MFKKRRILFFTAGAVPTPDEAALISVLDAVQRNASQVQKGDFPEVCDAVAGLVPEAYADRPRIDREMTDEELAALAAQEQADEAARAAEAAKREAEIKQTAGTPPDRPENDEAGAKASEAFKNAGWGNPNV